MAQRNGPWISGSKKMCRVSQRLMKRHVSGLVVPLVKTPLNSYCWIWSWKYCGNLSASATVMGRSIVASFWLTVACFFGLPCMMSTVWNR